MDRGGIGEFLMGGVDDGGRRLAGGAGRSFVISSLVVEVLELLLGE